MKKELKELNKGKRKKFVTVYKASGETQALFIKSILETSGIGCFLQSNAAPSVHAFVVDGMGEVRVMVEESQAEAARNLLGEENGV